MVTEGQAMVTEKERFNKLQQEQRDLDESYQQSKRCLLYTSPSPRDGLLSRMPSSA